MPTFLGLVDAGVDVMRGGARMQPKFGGWFAAPGFIP